MTTPTPDEIIEGAWDALKRQCCATPADSPHFDKVTAIIQVRKSDLAVVMSSEPLRGLLVECLEAMEEARLRIPPAASSYRRIGSSAATLRALVGEAKAG